MAHAGAGYEMLQEASDLGPPDWSGQSARSARGANATGALHTGADHGHGAHHAAIVKDTGEAPRRCTDLYTCACWLVMIVWWFAVLSNASIHGNLGRLTHGVDYYGRTCGNDLGVENKPFLFWCRSDARQNGQGVPPSLDLDHPICVETCPNSFGSPINLTCFTPIETANSTIGGGQFNNLKTTIVRIQESEVRAASYPTKPRGGRYCVPKNESLRSQILETPFRGLGPWSPRRILVALGTLGNAWWLFLLCGVTSVLFSYLYLYGMRFAPRYLVAFAVFLPALWCFATALGFSFFWMPWFWPGRDAGISKFLMKVIPIYHEWDVPEASAITAVLAIIFWLLFFFLCLLIQKFNGIVIADLTHAAFSCIYAVKTMWYQPIVEAIIKFWVFGMIVKSLQIIAAEGWVTKNNISINGARLSGLTRDYTPSLYEFRFYLMFIFWVAIATWTMEILNCFSQFVVSYEVFKYYGVKKDGGKKPPPSPNPAINGVKYGIIYHFGSILKGAMTIWAMRIPRLCYWAASTLFDPVNQATEETSYCASFMNCIQSCLSIACCGCGKCGEARCKNIILKEYAPNKDAFDDVVIRANDFDPACVQGHMMLEHSHPIVKQLYQKLDQMTITIVGIVSISTVNSAYVWILVSLLDVYKEPESDLYLADKPMVVICAWVLSAYIVFGFMTLWEHTCDSLLYCYAWSRKWDRTTVDKYIPQELRYIVGFDDTESDRYPYYGKAKNNMYLRSWLPMVGMDEKKKHQKPGGEGSMRSKMDSAPQQQAPLGSYMSGMSYFRGQDEAMPLMNP